MALLGIALAIVVVYYAILLTARTTPPAPDYAQTAVEAFLARHWAGPIPPQGQPPSAFRPEESSLAPEACGQCHHRQLEDWRASLHSKTMGPGIRWQFHLMAPADANTCMHCHAPLAEQKALMALEIGWPNAPASPPPAYVPHDLHRRGLVCAACHIRGHVRFGPPARDGRLTGREPGLPHGGFVATPAFQDSQFCAACHQFGEDGPRLNGKLLQNTYEEWRASRYARESISCQSCHMPERRHLWRGIHDAEMVRSAVTVHLMFSQNTNKQTEARATIKNSGAGHHLPTYAVPEIRAGLYLVGPLGNPEQELASATIARRTDVGLMHELFDTRLAVDGELEMRGTFSPPVEPGWAVELRLTVAPRAHYERFFEHALASAGQLPPEAVGLLRNALAEAKATRYEALRLRHELPGAP